jgi:hypothetical protein
MTAEIIQLPTPPSAKQAASDAELFERACAIYAEARVIFGNSMQHVAVAISLIAKVAALEDRIAELEALTAEPQGTS